MIKHLKLKKEIIIEIIYYLVFQMRRMKENYRVEAKEKEIEVKQSLIKKKQKIMNRRKTQKKL
jgi:hypothetical protein